MKFIALITGLLLAGFAHADDLPPLASPDAPNGYRGNPQVLAAGAASYEAHCARCHGAHSQHPTAEAPDLRRLDSFCRRLRDPALKAHCLKDVDSYFLLSVREGKVRAGVVHMPPWKDVLQPQDIWAIRTFVESLPPEPPRRTTSVDAARAASGH